MTRSRRRTRSRCSSPCCGASSRPKESRACCTRSAEPATSSARKLAGPFSRLFERISAAFDRLPIRTRLAVVSALLTFVILCGFALVVGSLTVHRIRSDFNREVAVSAANLAGLLRIGVTASDTLQVQPNIDQYAAPDHAFVRILYPEGNALQSTSNAPAVGAAN